MLIAEDVCMAAGKSPENKIVEINIFRTGWCDLFSKNDWLSKKTILIAWLEQLKDTNDYDFMKLSFRQGFNKFQKYLPSKTYSLTEADLKIEGLRV